MRPDEVLRFAFSQGAGKSIVTEPISVQAAPTTSGRLPAAARLTSTSTLPFGTVDLLADTPCPRRRVGLSGADRRVRLGHTLVAAFGLQRREPSNPYNDHRGIPSVRSKFPVHAFLTDGRRSQVLDVYRHALIDLDTASGTASPPDAPAAIALAGRYTHLPSFYQRLRGALVDLELGIGLRSLCVALDLFGIPYEVALPGARSPRLPADLGLTSAWEWSLPLVVRPWPETTAAEATPPYDDAALAEPSTPADDPTLGEVVAVNRSLLDAPPGAPSTASAHRLFARPARAFDEIAMQRVLGLDGDETVLIGTVCGTPRFAEPMLDLRL